MTIKKLIIFLGFIVLAYNLKAQEYLPFSVEIDRYGKNPNVILKQDLSTGNVIISLDVKGNITISIMGEAEIEYHWLQTAVSGKIKQIDNVKFEYYYDSQNTGKIKKIGNLLFTYYDYREHESKQGKVKSIGNYEFDYYDFMEEDGLIGKLAKVNNVEIGYYYGFENAGKIHKIGTVRINYNTDFDDNINAGKITGIIGSQPGVVVKTAVFNQSR